MKRILKFELHSNGPDGFTTGGEDLPRVLAVGFQGPQLCIWVEAEAGITRRSDLYVALTGEPVPSDAYEHVGTAQREGALGPFVVHVYRALRFDARQRAI